VDGTSRTKWYSSAVARPNTVIRGSARASRNTARILTTTALAALNALNSRDLALAAEQRSGDTSQRRDRLMNIDGASEKLGVKPDWLYRRHRRLSFTVPQGRMLRFSELEIEEYIRNRRHR
jgi:predicted DNA-binding transcriptional regulator AlpA